MCEKRERARFEETVFSNTNFCHVYICLFDSCDSKEELFLTRVLTTTTQVALRQCEARWVGERRELLTAHAAASTMLRVEHERVLEEVRGSLEDERDVRAASEQNQAAARAKLLICEQKEQALRSQLAELRDERRDERSATAQQGQEQRFASSLERGAERLEQSSPLSSSSPSSSSSSRVEPSKCAASCVSNSEAKLRQLQNKVVFLKSSLAMEMESKAELEQRLSCACAASREERAEHERRLREVRELSVAQQQSAEQRRAAQQDEHSAAASHLERKLASAQQAYADALHDAGQQRRGHEQAKCDADHSRVAKEHADRDAQQYRAQLNAQRDARDDDDDDDDFKDEDTLAGGTTMATESRSQHRTRAADQALRRLENEKQYLQAQLQSEVTCKAELERALQIASESLNDAQTQGAAAARRALGTHILFLEEERDASSFSSNLENKCPKNESAEICDQRDAA